MKWTMIAGIIALTTGCCNKGVVAYQQVRLGPVKKVAVVPVVTRMVPVRPVITRVVSPVVEPVLIDYVEPIDVTTTTIDFY